jgi:hypothetical protein
MKNKSGRWKRRKKGRRWVKKTQKGKKRDMCDEPINHKLFK